MTNHFILSSLVQFKGDMKYSPFYGYFTQQYCYDPYLGEWYHVLVHSLDWTSCNPIFIKVL